MPLHHLLPSFLFAAALAALSTAASGAPGEGGNPPPSPREAMPSRQHNDEALSDSVRRIERSTRGQVLSAERVPFDGRNVNRIKTVDDQGRVRVFMDDPKPPLPPDTDPPSN